MHSVPDSRGQTGHDWRVMFVVGVLALLALTLHLDATVLSNIHEARVLETARVMVVDQDWIVPRMDGEVRFNKPPLPYWGSAAAYVLAGQPSVFAARLVVAMLGALMLFATYLIGRAIDGPRLGLLAAAALTACSLFLDEFHTVTPDAYLAATVALSVAAFAWAMRSRGWRGQAAFAGGYVCLSLALLAKGPIALVFVLLGAWFTRPAQDRQQRPWSWHAVALLLAILPVVIWAWLVIRQAAGGLEVWSHEVLGRVTGEMLDSRGPFYYLPILLAAVSPLPVLFIRGLFRARGAHNGLLYWFAAGFVFLLFLSSRKAAYMLPLMPAAALLIGLALSDDEDDRWQGRAITVQLLLSVVLSAAMLGAAWAWLQHLQASDLLPGALLLATVLGLGLAWARAPRRHLILVILCNAVLITTFYEHVLKARLPDERAFHDMGQLIRRVVPPDAELLVVGDLEPRLSFYAGRVPKRVVGGSDLTQGPLTGQHWVLADRDLGEQAGIGWQRRFYAQTNKGNHVFYLYRLN